MSSKPIVQCFTDDLQKVVDKYRDSGLTVAEAVGGVELIKAGIIKWVEDDRDSEEAWYDSD
jgi:hypothetical protein